MNSFRLDERGVVGGAEGLIFGMLILLAGTLVVLNLWAIIDVRAALGSAAREYVRTYTESDDPLSARTTANAAARQVLEDRGGPRDVRIDVKEPNGFGPCSEVTVRISATVHLVKLPFLNDLGDTTVEVASSELVDAHREVTPSDSYARSETLCFSG